MAESKQVRLQGAYYGPPVLPHHQSSGSVGRSCHRGYCCFLCTVFKVTLVVILALGVIVLALWLAFRHDVVRVYVEKTSLSQFNLTADGALAYNLTMDVSVRNPKRRWGIYYDYVEALAAYGGSRFASTELPSFFLGHRDTYVLRAAFQGRQLALGSVADTYSREKREGFFYVDVGIDSRFSLKVWFVKTEKYSAVADCKLRLPVPGGGGASAAAVFTATKCDVYYL